MPQFGTEIAPLDRSIIAFPTCRRKIELRWFPPRSSPPRWVLSLVQRVDAELWLTAWVPTRITRIASVSALRVSFGSKKKYTPRSGHLRPPSHSRRVLQPPTPLLRRSNNL